MSGSIQDEARKRRARYPGALAAAIGCYVLVAMAGLFLLAADFSPVVLAPVWMAHGVLLVVLIRRLGARESSTYATLFVLAASVMAVYVADMARDDLILQQRGERTTAIVVREWRDPAEGRKARDYHYELETQDGAKVPGPDLRATSDRFDVGQKVTVIADPEGELRPKTPGEADATGDALGAAAFALASLGTVGWMAWRGSDAARRRDAQKGRGVTRKAYQTLAGNTSTPQEQEARLRAALSTQPADRRGYIRLRPEDFPDIPQSHAARIAWEMGLKAEAFGNRGAWRFGEAVIEEVPHD